jgi:PhoP regulatory network protein YrbL
MFERYGQHMPPLHLDHDLLIGRGGVRTVYQHPNDTDKCIKLLFNEKKKRAVQREEAYLRKYWSAHKPFDHLSRFFGHCHTTLGRGGIFELIKDYDGAISNPLAAFLPGNNLADKLSPTQIASLLFHLRNHLLIHCIIVSDPAPGNIVVKYITPDHPTLVLIDGIGNPHFIKIADYSQRAARKIIAKKWRYYVEDNPSLAGIF